MNSDLSISHINPQEVVYKTVEVWRCVSPSGSRCIPTEEFVPLSKFFVNSWPKSEFSRSKQLPRDQINAIRQNKMLHYGMSGLKVFQKLNTALTMAPKSLGKWQGAHSQCPELHWHFDIFITLGFQQIPHFLLWTEDFTSAARHDTVSMEFLLMKTHPCIY